MSTEPAARSDEWTCLQTSVIWASGLRILWPSSRMM